MVPGFGQAMLGVWVLFWDFRVQSRRGSEYLKLRRLTMWRGSCEGDEEKVELSLSERKERGLKLGFILPEQQSLLSSMLDDAAR